MKKILFILSLIGLTSCSFYSSDDLVEGSDAEDCLINYFSFVENEYKEVDGFVDIFVDRNIKYKLVKRHYDLYYYGGEKTYNVDLKDIVEVERTRKVKVIGILPICKNWALLHLTRK